jgi:hypothetical protein
VPADVPAPGEVADTAAFDVTAVLNIATAFDLTASPEEKGMPVSNNLMTSNEISC